ncbi:methylated-DNA--[protein]-cysteine S-methyltransferase [Paenibacillus aurantiacus]|uniref:Methylated-DNA--protein-cysteine methyltransferase n=1 Tax=Paenibacillus aurantiacus TaxID=1936118 RepID=A0ABV5KV55_9BACL
MNQANAVLVRWTRVDTEPGTLLIAATASGLGFIGSPNAPFEELERWARRTFPGGSSLANDDDAMAPYANQIKAYMNGESNALALTFDLAGTPFQREVWQTLLEIPYGETTTYSDIAHRIGRPAAVRAVGAAIGANPVLIGIPCHRVVGKNGALTGYRGGLAMKQHLLELEGRVHAGQGVK